MAVVALLLATSILPGFRLDTDVPRWWVAVLRLPILFALLLIILRPVLLLLTLPLNSITLGVPTLLFNGLILYLAAQAERAFLITNLGEALLGVLLMTIVSTGLVGWMRLEEAYPFFQSVIYKLGINFGPRREETVKRGLLVLQIDGLSILSLHRSLARGRMPTVSAMLAKRTHRLRSWSCGIPSNTPAVQAGMLYGSRENVAGYRWFDRDSQQIKVVSNPEDLRELEAMVSAGSEPLLENGSCINSFLSGGAAKRLMTVSALQEPPSERRKGENADFNLFFLSPFDYTKAVLGAMWDYLSGLVMTVIGRIFSDRPHLKFSFKRIAQRTVANSFLRDLAFFWLKQDMIRGVRVIYSNFVGYDDIAHHSGPDTYEAQISLAAFDRRLRQLRRRAEKRSPIKYDIVLLSDHGQTPSIPYRILFKETIEETLAGMLGRAVVRDLDPSRAFSPDASYTGYLLAALDEAGVGQLGWVANRGRRALERINLIAREIQSPGKAPKDGDAEPGVVVCVSGSLAHIYFTGRNKTLHLEEICALYPGFVEQLANHPGIGFVACTRQFGDAVVMCDDGIRNLVTGQIAGDFDPLEPYGQVERWSDELVGLLAYQDSGDLIINGRWLGQRQRIVVLEEQTSSHGGIGGQQTEPFFLFPDHWQVHESDLQSPEGLYRVLKHQLGNMGTEI